MSQAEQIERYLEREKGLKKDSTYKNKKYTLNHFEEWIEAQGIGDFSEVTSRAIEDYIISMSNDGYSPKTIDIRYTALKTVFEYLKDRTELIKESPFENVDRSEFSNVFSGTRKEIETREEISYITAEQVEQIVNHLGSPSLRNELIVRLMFQTGVREGEARTIRVDDFDRDERSIKIRAEKVHKNRKVYYQPSLDILLQQWIDGGYRSSHSPAETSPYLFLTRSSEKMSRGRISRIVKQAARDAGINEVMYVDKNGLQRWKITAHTLRHSHAVEALKSGIDLRSVQKHMGHASLNMTMRYLRVIEDDVRRAYQQFGTSRQSSYSAPPSSEQSSGNFNHNSSRNWD